MTAAGDIDARVRIATFAFLADQTRLHGDVPARALLPQGFGFEGVRVRLIRQGGDGFR